MVPRSIATAETNTTIPANSVIFSSHLLLLPHLSPIFDLIVFDLIVAQLPPIRRMESGGPAGNGRGAEGERL
jgi:hypothetical protein